MRESRIGNYRFSRKQGGVLRPAVGLLAFISAAGALGWMLLMPGALESKIESRTGFPVEADKLAVNPVGVGVTGENVSIANPDTYGGGGPMLQIERLRAKASLSALGRGEIWIEEMEMHISHARLVVDERGRLNLDAFARLLFADPETGAPQPFFAEKVRLVIDEVTFVDNSGVMPSSRQIRAALDTERADLEEARDLFAPLFELAERVGGLPVR